MRLDNGTKKIEVCLERPAEHGKPGRIKYRVRKDNSTSDVITSYEVYPHEWNDSCHAIKVAALAGERGDELKKIKRRIKNDVCRMLDFAPGGGNASRTGAADFWANSPARMYLGACILRLSERMRELNREGTSHTYLSAYNSFMRFTENEDMKFSKIKEETMEDYQAWLLSKGVCLNSVSFHMRILRAVWNTAASKGVAPASHPFKTVYTGVAKTRKRALDVKSIKAISDLDIKSLKNVRGVGGGKMYVNGYKMLEMARDVFMLCFYLRGISCIDLLLLKKADLKNGFVTYTRKKTGQSMKVRWEKEAEEIAKKYQREGSPYLLSFIHPAKGNEYEQAHNVLASVNQYLKIIGEVLDIPLALTTYVSRHSWATIARTADIPLSVISAGLGHDSEATTQIYLASIETAVVDKANRKIMNMLKRS